MTRKLAGVALILVAVGQGMPSDHGVSDAMRFRPAHIDGWVRRAAEALQDGKRQAAAHALTAAVKLGGTGPRRRAALTVLAVQLWPELSPEIRLRFSAP